MQTKYTVHTPTKKEFDELMIFMEGLGWTAGSPSRKPTEWSIWKNVEPGQMSIALDCQFFPKTLEYCDKGWYQSRDYTIITLKQAMEKLNPDSLENLEVGRLVIDQYQSKRKVLAKLDNILCLSWAGNVDGIYEHVWEWKSLAELKKDGYTVVPLESETIEVEGKKYPAADVREAVKGLKELNSMNTKPTGGPAFATGNTDGPSQGFQYGQEGMSLRDYFAGQVLTKLAHWYEPRKRESREEIAAECYLLADAMIAERDKNI